VKTWSFAIVCDVCNAPMGYWVVDNGMARCEACQKEYDIDQALMDDYQPDQYDLFDDPCTWGEHDWVGGDYADECMYCRVCGLVDC